MDNIGIDGQGTDQATPDVEAFRLRSFIERLVENGEAEVVGEPLALADLAARIDGNPRAVLFREAGPEGAELVANVMASRSRLAAAFDVAENDLAGEILARLDRVQPVVEVAAAAAPVQEIVETGEDADLTNLPVPFQHGRDGGPYISGTLDFTTDPQTGRRNIGARRLMLRGRRETGIDLVAPSDLKTVYEASAARGERLPVSFTLGAHPVDHVAASMRFTTDEVQLLANLRGAPLPMVKCVTNDLFVPADAEIVLEGYLDERGHVEDEGPFGEFLGYYGVMKRNPVFHLTAITRRRDALFQSATIGGRHLAHTDTAQLAALRTTVVAWRSLRSAVREPVAVYAVPASGGIFNVRVSLRQRTPGEARNAIAAVFSCQANVKNVFVVDDDIDVFSHDQIEWAFATRFQPDRDIVVDSGFRVIPLDPSLEGAVTGSKAGYDLTIPYGAGDALHYTVPKPPTIEGARFDTVRAALEDGPKTFEALMAALGTRDGREVVIALGELREDGTLGRLEDGAYVLGQG